MSEVTFAILFVSVTYLVLAIPYIVDTFKLVSVEVYYWLEDRRNKERSRYGR